MTDKEMLLFILNRAKEKGIIGKFFDANNETTDEIHNTWRAYQREVEAENAIIVNRAVDKFLDSYNGRELLKKYNLEDYGLWTVRGEDPNCDLGGTHHMPLVGHYEGVLEDVIKEAVQEYNFWTWGGGGDIKPLAPAEKIIKL